jgi:predicted outer membrane repeat protein
VIWIGKLRFVLFNVPGRLFLTTALLVEALFLLPARVAYAGANIIVNTLYDSYNGSDGKCSLPEAIFATELNADYHECKGFGYGSDTITFSVSGIITLTTILPAIIDDVTIDGTGQSITVSGNSAVQAIYVPVSQTLHLRSITIANGHGTNGGGIYNAGTLIVMNSAFSGNRDGGIFNDSIGTLTVSNSAFSGNSGSGISNIGTLTVTNSTFSGNGGVGGAISNNRTATVISSTFSGNGGGNGYYGGGGIFNDSSGTLTVNTSTFSGNYSSTGGGGIDNFGMLSVTDSTFLNNTSSMSYGSGGGIANFRRNSDDPAGTLTVSNSTFSGNSANGGGGIASGGTLTLTNSTFVGNYAAFGGGIASNNFSMTNTIIAYSPAGGDCSGYNVTGGNNLIDDPGQACGLTSTNGNIIGLDPLLGPLANNGGPTLTFLPQPGSPAINSGDNAVCPAFDQRGVARPQGGICDIGAVESLIWPRLYLPMVQK